MKHLTLGNTKEEMKKGVDTISNIVKVTLGGKGKNVVINNGFEEVKIINDGVSIAREVEVENDIENTGALLARKAAEKTNDEAGDGTTTTLVILQSFIEEMMKVQTTDVRGFRTEIEKHVDDIVAYLDKNKKDIGDGDIYRIAKNSSLDEEIAKTLEKLMLEIGKDGLISVEDGQKAGITSEVVAGVKIDDGFMSPYMITDGEKLKAVMKDAPILLAQKQIVSMKDILPILEFLQSKGINNMVLMVEDIADDVLAVLIQNKLKQVFNTCVIRTQNMQDIATITGATIVSEETGYKFEESMLGYADKVEIGQHSTLITGGVVEKDVIDAKVEELKKQREHADNEYEKQKISESIAKLQGGVSLIKIAGENDIQTKEKKLKLEDALNSVKSAMDDGIIEGGGMALMRVSNIMNKDTEAEKLVYNVIRSPFKQIMKNADEDVAEILKDLQGTDKGYNVITRQAEDFYESGIIDPVKVVKSALKNAVAMGTSIMTAEAGIILKKEEPKQQ